MLEGITIGAVGGAAAGLTVSLVGYWHRKTLERGDMTRVYSWLSKTTKDVDKERFRSTRAIASHNNLTEDRVRYICSLHEGIYLSTGDTRTEGGAGGGSRAAADLAPLGCGAPWPHELPQGLPGARAGPPNRRDSLTLMS